MPLESNKHPYSSLSIFPPSMNLMVSMAQALMVFPLQIYRRKRLFGPVWSKIPLPMWCYLGQSKIQHLLLVAQPKIQFLLLYMLVGQAKVQYLLLYKLLAQNKGTSFWKQHMGHGMHNLLFTIFVQNHCYTICSPIFVRKLRWGMKFLSFLIQLFLHCFPGLLTNEKREEKNNSCN